MSITTLNSTDSGSVSRTTINNNFTDLDTTKADIDSPVFTGNPTAPTPTTTDNDTSLATTAFVQSNKFGYTLQFSSEVSAPADATTYYIGPNAFRTMSTTDGLQKVRIPKAGTIKACYLEMRNVGTLGTAETSTISIRLNSTTDTTITSSFITSTNPSAFSNTSLSIAVVAGDYVEIKWVTPTWVTNPTNVDIWGLIYIE